MKIFYLAYIRMPNEKAHGIQIMKVCEALAQAGADLTLVVPGRKTHIQQNPFSYYGVKNIFDVKTLKAPDWISFGKVAFLISEIIFSLKTVAFLPAKSFFISQDEWVLLLGAFLGRRFIYEVHNGRANFATRYVSKRAEYLVANSHGTKHFYVKMGIPSDNILVYPNGVDIDKFNISLTSEECRLRFNLPQNKKIILYTGHLYDWKGTDTLAKVADLLPEDIQIIFVGGTNDDIDKFEKEYRHKSITMFGHVPNTEIPYFLRAADVLVIPNNKIGESEQFTSPMKLFEYLAAEKPIIASDLPSIREILNDSNAFFFQAGNVEYLAKVIQDVFADKEKALYVAKQAKQDALKYTWDRGSLYQKISLI